MSRILLELGRIGKGAFLRLGLVGVSENLGVAGGFVEEVLDEILGVRGVGERGRQFFLLDHLDANIMGLNKINTKRL